jgi:hypothetical protein
MTITQYKFTLCKEHSSIKTFIYNNSNFFLSIIIEIIVIFRQKLIKNREFIIAEKDFGRIICEWIRENYIHHIEILTFHCRYFQWISQMEIRSFWNDFKIHRCDDIHISSSLMIILPVIPLSLFPGCVYKRMFFM